MHISRSTLIPTGGLSSTAIIIAVLLILMSYWPPFYPTPAFAQFTEDSMTIEVSTTGEARIREEITTATTVPRISLVSISANVSNLLAVDENNIILRSVITENNQIMIDTLGASHVTLSYNAQIINRTLDIWNVHYTSTIDSKVVLPVGSELLFVSNIPIDIVENTIVMPAGKTSLSYKTRGLTTGSFSVSYDGTEYTITILSTSGIRSLSLDQPSKSILIHVNAQEPMLVIIPTNLLGGPYDVRAENRREVEFKEYYQNATHSWIRIEPNQNGTDAIRITGTTVIPEFQQSLPLIGIAVTLAVLISYSFGRFHIGKYGQP